MMRSTARKLRAGELLMRPHFRVRCVLEVTLLRSQQHKPTSQYQRKLGGGYWDDDCHRNRHQRSGVRRPGSCESSGCSSATWSPRLAGALSAHARHTRWFVRRWAFPSRSPPTVPPSPTTFSWVDPCYDAALPVCSSVSPA